MRYPVAGAELQKRQKCTYHVVVVLIIGVSIKGVILVLCANNLFIHWGTGKHSTEQDMLLSQDHWKISKIVGHTNLSTTEKYNTAGNDYILGKLSSDKTDGMVDENTKAWYASIGQESAN